MRLPERLEMAGAMNAAWKANPGYKWYGLLTDGVHPMTRGWDRLMVAAAGERNMASCDDGWRGGRRMGGIVLFPGWMLEALGWWVLPGLVHLYMDAVWEHLGFALGNWVYVPSVRCDYRHHANGRVPPDESNKRSLNGMPYTRPDQDRYNAWLRAGPAADLARVRGKWEAMKGEPW